MTKTRKLFASLFALVLCASMALVALAPAGTNKVLTQSSPVAQLAPGKAYAAESMKFVYDQSGFLTENEISNFESQARAIFDKYGVGTYYVATNSLSGRSDAGKFAADFYSEYGQGEKNGAVVFIICKNEDEYALEAYGKVAGTIGQSGIEHIDSDVVPYLRRGDWSGAAETLYGDVLSALSGGKGNSTTTEAYTQGTYVVDNYGLFSDEQRAQLESFAKKLAEKYNMGVYLLVVGKMDGRTDPTSAQRTNFATSFYRANNLGLGTGHDGIMIVFAVESRDYVTIAYGQGSYSFNDEGIESMEEGVVDELKNNNWYSGAEAYYKAMETQLAYYAEHGKPWTEPDPLALILKILAILLVPFIIAKSIVGSEKAAMQTARMASEASDYLVPNSLKLRVSDDTFVNTTLVTTPIPKNEDKGGGGSFGGGGGWGGGGGGGFSSSGGGKF